MLLKASASSEWRGQSCQKFSAFSTESHKSKSVIMHFWNTQQRDRIQSKTCKALKNRNPHINIYKRLVKIWSCQKKEAEGSLELQPGNCTKYKLMKKTETDAWAPECFSFNYILNCSICLESDVSNAERQCCLEG